MANETNVLKLNNVRVAFPTFFEPKINTNESGKTTSKYSGAFIFPKDHPQVKQIEAAIVAVATAKWGPEKAPTVLKSLKAANKICVYDGDSKADYAGYAGNLFINASNEIRPLVLSRSRTPLSASDGVIYSGCFVNVMLQFWAQDSQQYGKRINASLMGVQFWADGERMSGGAVASVNDFEAIPEEAATEAEGASKLF